MDAVVFMDAAKQPQQATVAAESEPPARDQRPLMSANASLVAGVATLVLAIGVGVLIGRSGDHGSSNVAAQPQIIKVGGGGGEVEAAGSASKEAKGSGGGAHNGSKTAKKAKEKTKTGSSGASKATEEAYEPAPGVKLPPAEQKLGGECEPGVSGCSKNGKFEGTFFE
jgi:hypothetical protein